MLRRMLEKFMMYRVLVTQSLRRWLLLWHPIITPNRSELRQVVGRWQDEADLTARAQALREKLKLEALLLTRSEMDKKLDKMDAKLDRLLER